MFMFILFAQFAFAEFEVCTVMDAKGTAFIEEVDGLCSSDPRFGSGKFVLIQSAEKQNKRARMDRIKKGCAGQTGILKELCDEVTAGK